MRTRRSTRATVAGIEAGGDDLVGRLVLLDVALQDLVEHVVRRQRILIGLVRAAAPPTAPWSAIASGITGAARASAFSQRATR